MFKTDSLGWKQIYLQPHLVTLESYSQSFFKQCFLFKKTLLHFKDPFYKLFYHLFILHIFCECDIIQNLRDEHATFFKNDLLLLDLTMQAAILGFPNLGLRLHLRQNHLLLIFNMSICNSRRSESLILKSLTRKITKV